MSQSKQWIIVGVAVSLAIVAFAVYYLYRGTRPAALPPSVGEKQNPEAGSSTPMAEKKPVGEEKPSASVLSQNMPVFARPITFSSSFSAEARTIMEGRIAASIAAIQKDPRSFDAWMQLAVLRKAVDDYEGAVQIWEFLKTIYPKQPGPYANLAALYTYELKNPALAEQNFIEAIRKGPKEVSVYRNAYDFYRYVQKDDVKAKQMLQDGARETRSPDLQYLLDHYDAL